MEPKKRRLHNKERGQSLVELSIGFLLLILLLAGIVDVGRLLFYNVTLRDSAQEGVNFGAVQPKVVSDIQQRAQTSLDSSVVITVTFVDKFNNVKASTAACTGDRIQVEVTQPDFQFNMPVIGMFLGTNHISLSQSVSGTVLRPACPG